MNLKLNSREANEMRAFYENERNNLIARLEHIDSILPKIKGGVIEHNTKTQKSEHTPKRKRKQKRGRKSIWGEFILNTLKTLNRPVSYSEMIQAAKLKFNIKDENDKTLKAAINQAAFRLRTVHKKISTIGEPGKKERRLVLTSWIDDGKLVK